MSDAVIDPPAGAPPAGQFLGAPPAAAAAPAAGAAAPAPNSTGFFGEHVHKDGAFVEGWTASLAEKHPGLANQLMRYKNEADAFTGLENLVKTVGKKTAGVAYPKAGATPEEIAAFRTDAGVPGRAEDYQLKPEKLPDGMVWDDVAGKTVAEISHKHHVPAAAAKEFAEAYHGALTAKAAEQAAAVAAKQTALIQKTTAEFQKEWGVGYQDRYNALSDFVNARLTPEDMADPALQVALSHPGIVRIIDEARRASREAPLPGATGPLATGSMSPRQSAMEIMKTTPNWRQDPQLAARVNDLYKQEAQAEKRRN